MFSPQLGEPLIGIWCSSVAPLYLAGLCKVPAKIPTLVLALGHEFLVASSAVGVLRLSRLSKSIVRWSFQDL